MNRRIAELMGMIFIGDGLLSMLEPRRHTALWMCGPKIYKQAAHKLEDNPAAARGLGLVLVGLGLWLSTKANKV